MADTKISALPAATTAATANEFAINEAGTSKKLSGDLLRDFLGVTKVRLAASVGSASATPTKVTGLDRSTPTGTFIFEYFLRWRTTGASTGIRLDCNYSGTVTSFVWNQRWVDSTAAAATATPDQDAIGAAGQVIGAFSSRAKGTAGRGVLLSADTSNLDMFIIIEGLMVVTVAGDLQLYHGAETTGPENVQVMQDSVLRLTKIT